MRPAFYDAAEVSVSTGGAFLLLFPSGAFLRSGDLRSLRATAEKNLSVVGAARAARLLVRAHAYEEGAVEADGETWRPLRAEETAR